MSDTTFGLDDATLERAAEAHYDHYLRGFATKPDDSAIPTWRTRGPSPDAKRMFVESMRAALPVIGPEIERTAREALVREMMESTKGWIIIKDDERGELMDTWLVEYLPAAEERESEGVR